MRLIDADELIAEISNPKYPYTYDAERVFKRMIDNAPTVDAVPVVRCKDCKYLYRETEFCKSCIEVKRAAFGFAQTKNGGVGMNDLISRTAAIKAFTGKPPEYYHTSYIVGELNDIPAVDAVPVVRCSECRYCFNEDRETPYDGESWWYCERWNKETNVHGTDPYRFFCADAERRCDV